jgi:hypothetical protein
MHMVGRLSERRKFKKPLAKRSFHASLVLENIGEPDSPIHEKKTRHGGKGE